MTLIEAWVSSPTCETCWDKKSTKLMEELYHMDIVQNIIVSIIDPKEPMDPIIWLVLPNGSADDNYAQFNAKDMGDLRDYLDEAQNLEIQTEIQFNKQSVLKYWRDECKLSDDCFITLPFSMQFKMVE